MSSSAESPGNYRRALAAGAVLAPQAAYPARSLVPAIAIRAYARPTSPSGR